jgi:hypothetical protein
VNNEFFWFSPGIFKIKGKQNFFLKKVDKKLTGKFEHNMKWEKKYDHNIKKFDNFSHDFLLSHETYKKIVLNVIVLILLKCASKGSTKYYSI